MVPPNTNSGRPHPAFHEELPLPVWTRWGSAGVILVVAVVFVALVVAPPEDAEGWAWALGGASLVIGLAAAGVGLFGRQVTDISGDEVILAFTPLWKRRLRAEDLSVESGPALPGLEYGGFGVRIPGNGRTAVVANPGPCITLRDQASSRLYIIRTDRPAEFAAAVGRSRLR